MDQEAHFESEFLESLAAAFRRRRKAISHGSQQASCAKVYESTARQKLERLEIHIQMRTRGKFRLHAWPDRMVWLDARKSAKAGWAWEWTLDGRLLGQADIGLIIGAVEKSLELFYEIDGPQVHKFAPVWIRLVAQGPKKVQ